MTSTRSKEIATKASLHIQPNSNEIEYRNCLVQYIIHYIWFQ